MNFSNFKVPKMPGGGAISALIKLGVVAVIGAYGVANSLYNVDGGHRAIVFNRITGVKEKVRSRRRRGDRRCHEVAQTMSGSWQASR